MFLSCLPRYGLAVSYITCCKLVQQGVLLSFDDWASALSLSCTMLWLLFLSLLVFHFTGFIAFSCCVFTYTDDYPRSQLPVASPTVCPTHCSCATNIHLIPESADDEVYHMPVSRAGMRPGGLGCIFLF